MCDAVGFCAGGHVTHETHSLPKGMVTQRLGRLANWHGVLGCVAHYLNESCGPKSKLAIGVKPILYRKAIERALYLKQLDSVTESFNAMQIDYVIFKGAAATAQFYGHSFDCLRSSADIDFLVKPSHFLRAVQTLCQLGYRSIDCDNAEKVAHFVTHSADKLCKRGLVFRHKDDQLANVDIHWRVANTFSLPLDADAILESRQAKKIGQNDCYVPSFSHHFIASAIHGYLDYFFQLKHLADLYFAMHCTDYNQQSILAIAEDLGVRNQVFESMSFAHVMFSTSSANRNAVSAFEKKAMNRYVSFNGWVPRYHNVDGEWSLMNKLSYIFKQINTRSKKASWSDPIRNRFLVKFEQL